MSKVINENKLLSDRLQHQGINISSLAVNNTTNLNELTELSEEVDQIANNSDQLLDNLKSVKLPSIQNLSFKDVAEIAEAAQGSINLFDEYIVNVAKKSYAKLKKIKENKECTNFDFFKGCVEFAADMFYALKHFYKKVKETYPIVTVAELTFAQYLAPVYAAVELVSGIMSICGYKDNTVELIDGGKELRKKAQEAAEAKKEAEKEIEGTKLESVSKSCKVLSKAGVLDSVTTIASNIKSVIDIAAHLEKTGVNKELVAGYIKKISDVASFIPKSNKEVPAFIDKLIPDSMQLMGKDKNTINIFKNSLINLKDNTSVSERISLVTKASVKLYESFSNIGSKISEPLKEFISKITEIKTPKGFENIAKAEGFGMAFAEIVSSSSKTITPSVKQRT